MIKTLTTHRILSKIIPIGKMPRQYFSGDTPLVAFTVLLPRNTVLPSCPLNIGTCIVFMTVMSFQCRRYFDMVLVVKNKQKLRLPRKFFLRDHFSWLTLLPFLFPLSFCLGGGHNVWNWRSCFVSTRERATM